MSILDTCLHQDMQYKYFCNSHSTLWHSKCGFDILHETNTGSTVLQSFALKHIQHN